MLDDEKTQAIYNALNNSPGLSSPAAAKVTDTLDKGIAIKNRFEALKTLPPDAVTALPEEVGIKIPPEIRAAAEKFGEYHDKVKNANDALSLLGGAIDKRMDDVTSKFAVLGVAAGVAQKMGDAGGGCGPLGSAFSVLTSSGRTDILKGLLESAEGPLGELEDLVNRYRTSISGVISDTDKELLESLNTMMDAIKDQIEAATAALQLLVDEAEEMFDHLMNKFNTAVQSSILGSIIHNPCLRDIADSVMPDNVKQVIDGFGL